MQTYATLFDEKLSELFLCKTQLWIGLSITSKNSEQLKKKRIDDKDERGREGGREIEGGEGGEGEIGRKGRSESEREERELKRE